MQNEFKYVFEIKNNQAVFFFSKIEKSLYNGKPIAKTIAP